MWTKRRKGSVILEVLIAIGVSAIFFSAIAGLLISSNKSTANLYNTQKAYARNKEGLSALQSIKFEDLFLTWDGKVTYNSVTDQWELSTGSEVFADNQTRSVAVIEVQRNEDCEVVLYGGDVDPDSYILMSNMMWDSYGGGKRDSTIYSLVVNTENPQGDCFGGGEEAENLVLITVDAEWYGDKQLRDLYITNEGTSPVTITEITIWWDVSKSKIEQIFYDGDKVWSYSGPGSPSGKQYSGTQIDIDDIEIPAGYTGEFNKIKFSKDMEDATLIIEFEFSDGSTYTSDPFEPDDD